MGMRTEKEQIWDMDALLEKFDYVEWDLDPASNLEKQTLDLDDCDLDTVPAAITELEYYALKDVEAVSLNNNTKIKKADILGQLLDLEAINMWGCELREIPQSWSRLTKLKMLGLGKNKKLTNFGPMGHLTNLVWLDLGGCELRRIPEEVTNLMKLKVLALGGNPGMEIGEEICSLGNLQKLGLNDCELYEIPESVFSLLKLTHLHLDNNYISKVGKAIAQLTDLQVLTVTGNKNIALSAALNHCDTAKNIIVDESTDLSEISATLRTKIQQISTTGNKMQKQDVRITVECVS